MRLDAPVRSAAGVALAGAIALAIGLGIGRFAFTPLLPMMQADAGVTILSGSWLAAANSAGYLVGALAGVRWRIASPAVIRAGMLAVAATTFGMGLTNDYLVWLLLRGVAGTASAWILVATSAWTLATLAATGHAHLAGVVFSGVGWGIAVAGTFVLAAMAAGHSSSETWVALGLVALVATAASWNTLLRDAGTGRLTQRAAPPVRGSVSWEFGRTLLLVTCYGIFGFGYIIPATFLPAAARQIVANPLLFGLSWPLFGLAGAASTLVIGRLGQRWTDRTTWICSYLVLAVGVGLPALSDSIVALLVSALAVGGTFMVITMVGLREARSLAGPGAAQLIAAMTAAFATGQILGPLVAGQFFRVQGSFAPALLSAAALLIACAAVLIWDAKS